MPYSFSRSVLPGHFTGVAFIEGLRERSRSILWSFLWIRDCFWGNRDTGRGRDTCTVGKGTGGRGARERLPGARVFLNVLTSRVSYPVQAEGKHAEKLHSRYIKTHKII